VDELPPCIQNIGLNQAPPCDDGACAEHLRKLCCMPRTLKPRQPLFFEGDKQSHVYLVKAGAVCLYRMLRNGRRQVIGFKLPGEFIALGNDGRHGCSAEAIGATELRSFQSLVFQGAAAGDARFLLKLYQSVAQDLARTQEQALSVGQRDAEGSVAAFLLNVEARTAGETPGAFLSLPMSRADIADFLSLSLETISRVLTGFKRMRLIDLSGRRGLRLVDRKALRALSEGVDAPRRDYSLPQRLN
jgi:CRP-like cAMP-binding protein